MRVQCFEYKGYGISITNDEVIVWENPDTINELLILKGDSIADAKAYVDIVTYKPE